MITSSPTSPFPTHSVAPHSTATPAAGDPSKGSSTRFPGAGPEPAPMPGAERPFEPSAATRAVRAGLEADLHHGAVVPPIHLSSTFTFRSLGEPRPFDYTRSGNPTRALLAEALAAAEGGAGATVTSTGMSAVALVFQLLEPGDLLVASRDCYGGTHRLLCALEEKGRLRVRWVDPEVPGDWRAAVAEKPRLVWVETPSNPLLRITDLAEVTTAARACGALVAVDNTFLSPVLQRPLELGADLAVHSTTKYLNGHSDVVGGAVVAATEELAEEVAWWANCLGITGSPFDSYLTLRGLRTLHARMGVHEANARRLVEVLSGHPAVARVYHPSLPEHPGHAVAARQQQGFGAMVSFELRSEAAVRAFLGGLTCFSLAESLGGVESLVAHPATMTHVVMSPEDRQRAGISDALLRLSVGIEAGEDLAEDVRRGLDRAGTARSLP